MSLMQGLKQAVKKSLGAVEYEKDRLSLLFSPPASVDEWLTNAKDSHRGESCFIIANGPGLNLLDLDKLKGQVCFGVNGIYLLNNIDLTYYVYVSSWWHKNHLEEMRNVKCTRRFIPGEYYEELHSHVPTTWYRKIDPKNLSRWGTRLPVPTTFSKHCDRYIVAGGSVMFVCLQLAYFFGFEKVYLIGLDHSYSKEKDSELKKKGGGRLTLSADQQSHFSPAYNKTTADAHIDLYAMERGYVLAKRAFEKDGRKIYNASAQTQLEVFEKVDYNSLFI